MHHSAPGQEGGQAALSPEEYEEQVDRAARGQGALRLVDIELACGEARADPAGAKLAKTRGVGRGDVQARL